MFNYQNKDFADIYELVGSHPESSEINTNENISYPVYGLTSAGAYHATSKEDLNALYNYLQDLSYFKAADELREAYPSEFPEKVLTVELTQKEIDQIALVFGFVVGSYELGEKFDKLASSDVIADFGINYDLVDYNVDADGLTLKIQDF